MPNGKDLWGHYLITRLNDLADPKNPRGRGTLATLRRALQRPPGQDSNVFPYVVPLLPEDLPPAHERAVYLIASLFAAHSDMGGEGTLGKAFNELGRRLARGKKEIPQAVERRFVALLNADIEDLHRHLRHAISLLKANDVRVDWEQLLNDLIHWDDPGWHVRENWARDFWRIYKGEQTPENIEMQQDEASSA